MKNQRFIYHRPAVFDNGFTLIEVLVTLIVLSVGLLSLAGLQVFGLRTSHSASLRTQATIQSYDIIDRMRANLRGVQAGNYNQPTQEGSAGEVKTACEAIIGTTNGCSTQDMASHDLFKWNQAIADVLPGGVGVVCIDTTPEDGATATIADADSECDGLGSVDPRNATYAVKIWWNDDSSNSASVPQLFTTSFRP